MYEHDVMMFAALLMHGVAMKTGGFGTEGDRENAVKAAEGMVVKSLEAAQRIRIKAREIEQLADKDQRR